MMPFCAYIYVYSLYSNEFRSYEIQQENRCRCKLKFENTYINVCTNEFTFSPFLDKANIILT